MKIKKNRLREIILEEVNIFKNLKESENILKNILNVDEDTAKKIYYKYKDNTDVEGLTSKLFENKYFNL